MNDPFGQAISDYYKKGKAADIKINSNYTKDEKIPVSYFFRNENEMPEIEKAALKNCKGTILDVGAAAGCHSLVLQKKGFNVTALEKSELSADVLKQRGIQKVILVDIFESSGDKFDTILLLMNGAGIGGTVNGLKKLLFHLKKLIHSKGQILIDSSDIKYLFDENDGSTWIELTRENYYGEMEYEVAYKNITTTFNWLFIDFELLSNVASEAGFNATKILEGNHFDYLARLTPILQE